MRAAISPTSCLSIPRTTTWVGCGTSNSIPSGRLDRDRVRVAERELERLALEPGAVADALDLEALLEAVGDALDHVRDQAAGQPVQGAVLAAVGRALDGQRCRRPASTFISRADRLAQLALRALDRDHARLDVDRRRRRGSVIGFLPIRLMSSGSPDVGDDLAADALLLRPRGRSSRRARSRRSRCPCRLARAGPPRGRRSGAGPGARRAPGR